MPVTRRRRANPPEQPENNHNNHVSETPENPGETQSAEQQSALSQPQSQTELPLVEENPVQPTSSLDAQPEEAESQQVSFLPPSNGVRHDYNQTIEGGRRTSRGELFRRPPQPPSSPIPAAQSASPAQTTMLQPPSHEIKLPLGVKPGDATGDPLHLAYNPGYTGSDEARSALLRKLATESKHGGRARCWGCGSLAVAYECWNTRNKTFGEIGIAYCEICGVWSVM
jgi:hypothetical protein